MPFQSKNMNLLVFYSDLKVLEKSMDPLQYIVRGPGTLYV